MIKALIERLRQKERTIEFPGGTPVLPERFRGLPAFGAGRLPAGSPAQCPVGAISEDGPVLLDLGKCIFCGRCEKFSGGAISFGRDYRLAVSDRRSLLHRGGELALARALDEKSRAIFGRSLKLRQVSAGGCNACEADVNVLGTPVFDLGRFGVQFVASPRHADGLLITGPVTKNMESALRATYDAVPEPKIVIAAGACAISGGIYSGHAETRGIPADIPVSLYIPGCPPHPLTILDGILRLLGKINR